MNYSLTNNQIQVVHRINQLFKRFQELWIDDLLADDSLQALSPDEIREATETCPLIKLGNHRYILYCHDLPQDAGEPLATEEDPSHRSKHGRGTLIHLCTKHTEQEQDLLLTKQQPVQDFESRIEQDFLTGYHAGLTLHALPSLLPMSLPWLKGFHMGQQHRVQQLAQHP